MRELSMNEVEFVSGANAAQIIAGLAVGTVLTGLIAAAANPYPTYYNPYYGYGYNGYNYYNYGYPYTTTDVIVYDYGYPGYSVTYVY